MKALFLSLLLFSASVSAEVVLVCKPGKPCDRVIIINGGIK